MALRNYTSDLVYIALVFVAPIIVNQLKSDFQASATEQTKPKLYVENLINVYKLGTKQPLPVSIVAEKFEKNGAFRSVFQINVPNFAWDTCITLTGDDYLSIIGRNVGLVEKSRQSEIIVPAGQGQERRRTLQTVWISGRMQYHIQLASDEPFNVKQGALGKLLICHRPELRADLNPQTAAP